MNQENIKIVEIRDIATFIPALAIKTIGGCPREKFIFKQIGYWQPCILLISLQTPWFSARSSSEWEKQDMGRTMGIAHKYIEENFDSIVSLQVIDVEFLKGEKDHPCANAFEEELRKFVEVGLAIQNEKSIRENS